MASHSISLRAHFLRTHLCTALQRIFCNRAEVCELSFQVSNIFDDNKWCWRWASLHIVNLFRLLVLCLNLQTFITDTTDPRSWPFIALFVCFKHLSFKRCLRLLQICSRELQSTFVDSNFPTISFTCCCSWLYWSCCLAFCS